MKEEEHGQNGENIFSSIIGRRSSILVKYFIQFCFDMFYAVKSSDVELTLKLKTRTEFPNVWGEYKNHI